MRYENERYENEEVEVLNVRMCVVPKPTTGARTVLVPEAGEEEPLIVGSGSTNYLCGHCGAVLAGRVGPEEVDAHPVFQCYACGSYNELPDLSST